jgi:hypothetical protein
MLAAAVPLLVGRIVLRLCRLCVLLPSAMEVVSTSFIIVGRRMTAWGLFIFFEE